MDKGTARRRRHGPTICSKAKEMPILLEILMTRRQRAYIIEPMEYSCMHGDPVSTIFFEL